MAGRSEQLSAAAEHGQAAVPASIVIEAISDSPTPVVRACGGDVHPAGSTATASTADVEDTTAATTTAATAEGEATTVQRTQQQRQRRWKGRDT